MNNIHSNIRLNIKTLKDIFNYFDLNDNNTIIELNTKSDRVRNNIKEYKDKILLANDKSIYLKGMVFGKLFYFLSKNIVLHIVFYKCNSVNKIDSSLVKIEVRSDKISNIYFDESYDYNKTKEFLKKYNHIDIEYIVLFILLVVSIIIYYLRN